LVYFDNFIGCYYTLISLPKYLFQGLFGFFRGDYLENIYIFRSSGKIENYEAGFIEHNNQIDFKISEYIELILFEDERKKLTFRLSKSFLRSKKEKIKIAIINKNGSDFHNEIKKLRGLPTYRGIQIQRVGIKKYINKLQKQYKTYFKMPMYL
jgi:hypothetical protein